jgi:hypothetical protein
VLDLEIGFGFGFEFGFGLGFGLGLGLGLVFGVGVACPCHRTCNSKPATCMRMVEQATDAIRVRDVMRGLRASVACMIMPVACLHLRLLSMHSKQVALRASKPKPMTTVEQATLWDMGGHDHDAWVSFRLAMGCMLMSRGWLLQARGLRGVREAS